jgi:hypothetical protein
LQSEQQKSKDKIDQLSSKLQSSHDRNRYHQMHTEKHVINQIQEEFSHEKNNKFKLEMALSELRS